MHVHRRFLGWGVFFILLGAIPLAVQAGLLTAAQVADWWRFWPLILVGIGLGLLLRAMRSSKGSAASLSLPRSA